MTFTPLALLEPHVETTYENVFREMIKERFFSEIKRDSEPHEI